MGITEELSRNRDKIQSAHGKVRDVDSLTGTARKLLSRMTARDKRQKMMTYCVLVFLFFTILIVVYLQFGGGGGSDPTPAPVPAPATLVPTSAPTAAVPRLLRGNV
jgi:hypothetical protein